MFQRNGGAPLQFDGLAHGVGAAEFGFRIDTPGGCDHDVADTAQVLKHFGVQIELDAGGVEEGNESQAVVLDVGVLVAAV